MSRRRRQIDRQHRPGARRQLIAFGAFPGKVEPINRQRARRSAQEQSAQAFFRCSFYLLKSPK
jgi:hypothetical protein